MKFNDNRPIYLQIVDLMGSKIISGEWAESGRIASVREFGVTLAVNPSTVLRAYEELSSKGVIEQRRGIGYFVCEDGRDRMLAIRRDDFIEKRLPELFDEMTSIGISIAEVSEYYKKYTAW